MSKITPIIIGGPLLADRLDPEPFLAGTRPNQPYRYPFVIGMRRSFPNARCVILIPIGA